MIQPFDRKTKRIFFGGWVGLLLLLNQVCFAQSEYGKYQLGIYLMSGNSLGIAPVGPALKNQVNALQHGFVGSGIYSYIQLRDDSTYNTTGYLRFLRVDLGIASRAGIFEPTAGNFVRLTSADVDLSVLLPLSFKAAKEIYAYVSAGPVMSYQFGQVITPVQPQPLPEMSKTKLGLAIELGFKLKSGSAFGFRTMTQSGDFSYRVGSIFFGFSPKAAPRRRKR